MFPKKENLQIEFKDDSRDSYNFDDVIRECVGLSNAEGGAVFCGIKDNGEVIGSNVALKKGIDGIKFEIRAKTRPGIDTEVEILKYKDDCSVVKITVPKGQSPVCTAKGAYVKRVVNAKGAPENVAMDVDAILNTAGRIGTRDLSAQTLSGLTINDIDLDLVLKTAEDIKNSNPSEVDIHIYSQEPVDILKTLGLVNRNGLPNIACLLLFGYEESILDMIPNHFVQYQVFVGDGLDLVRNEKYTLPIARLLPMILEFPELNRKTNEILVNGRSVVIPEYSRNSVREAIANAMNHRDYTLHSGIQIQVYPQELIVCSAGGFVSGISIDNLLHTPPTPRNTRLNDAMTKLKLVESSGRGIDTIYYWQAKYGRPAPDYSMSDDYKVEVVLAGGTANMDFVKEMISIDVKDVSQMMILNSLFLKNTLSLSEISSIIQLNESRTKTILTTMLNKKLIYTVGSQKDSYVLYNQKDISRKITKAEADALKEKILKELKKSDGLTKSELSIILSLSESQTYRLLSSLKDDGLIETDRVTRNWKLK